MYLKDKFEVFQTFKWYLARVEKEEKLAINLQKCEFMKKELVYLGFFVS